MKNFPRTVKRALMILSILCVQACTHRTIKTESGMPAEIDLEEAAVKTPDTFCAKIGKVSESATYDFVVSYNGKTDHCCQPTPCKESNLRVKIDRVTKASPAATAAGATPFWGSHVTQRLSAIKSEDLSKVVNELEPELGK